jgi:hypothetical protein
MGDSIPTREETDQLAAGLPADRTGWDGQPLDDAGRRRHALRESGYTGWIDQDGYPIDAPPLVRPEDRAANQPVDVDEA